MIEINRIDHHPIEKAIFPTIAIQTNFLSDPNEFFSNSLFCIILTKNIMLNLIILIYNLIIYIILLLILIFQSWALLPKTWFPLNEKNNWSNLIQVFHIAKNMIELEKVSVNVFIKSFLFSETKWKTGCTFGSKPGPSLFVSGR